MRRFLPKSLAGQIGLLVAVALFVAQAINFAILLNERRGARFAQVIVPAATRLADANERLGNAVPPPAESGTPNGRDFYLEPRTRVRLLARNPIGPGEHRNAQVEANLQRALQDAGLESRQVIAIVRPIDSSAAIPKGQDERRANRLRRMGAELIVAVERPDGHWLSLRGGWPLSERILIWQLLAQTLILYVVVLVPLLLAGRRISRPLRNLAQAARGFTPGGAREPLEEHGPSDVRSVITAYNALGLRVNAMIDEKDRMLGAIGHDLRTPLAALRVRIESVEDDEDRERMAGTIDEMNRTLDDILSLARLGRPSEPVTEVDMAALVDAVVDDFRDLDHEVAFEEAPRLRMRLRPTLMRRAVRNLIENAIKYAGSAEVRLIAGDKAVAIEVCDRGPGIPQGMLDTVFDPFTRLEQSRNRETGGIGLGLALARAIVRDAGGEIVLTNREGGGLTATITLPRG